VELKTVLTCPLGAKCEEIKDNAIHRCAWFVQLSGQNPQTGEMQDEKGCAMSWLPVLLVENSRVSRGTSAAVESFRNEMVKSNETNLKVLMNTVATVQPDMKLISDI
jgi:hypothetical protein